MRRPASVLALLALVASGPALADPSPCPPGAGVDPGALGTPAEDLARVCELAGAAPVEPRLIRRGGASLLLSDDVVSLPLRLESVWNSRYPSGQNDGVMWAGRGLAQTLTAGVAIRKGPFSAALQPEVTWSENRAFELRPTGDDGALRFANPYYGASIDLPQRMGAGPWATWAPGQSYARLDLWNVALGVSSENLWLGPGIRNSIILSNAGPGFPHVFLGTSHPADIRIGTAEALVLWGRLERSRFFSEDGTPLVIGLTVDYSPRWVPGLSVGLARVMLQPWDGLRFRDYFAILQSFQKQDLQGWYSGGDNAQDNQLASVFARWVFPESGLELWAEWAREDHAWSWWTFIREPDHSQAYQLGLQKVFRAGSRLVRLHLEVTHLQEKRPLANESGVPVYYTHPNDLSYTHEGQLLGAWIGPGADSQLVAVDVLHAGGRIGGYIERVRRYDAYYWAVIEPGEGALDHDAELAFGARQVLRTGPLELSWDASFAWRQDRDFLVDEPNVRVQLGIAVPLPR